MWATKAAEAALRTTVYHCPFMATTPSMRALASRERTLSTLRDLAEMCPVAGLGPEVAASSGEFSVTFLLRCFGEMVVR